MRPRLKNVAVLAIALALASLGIYNIVLKASWTLMDDGVFWSDGPLGVQVARVAAGGPGGRAGLRTGDVLLAVGDREILRAEDVPRLLASRRPGDDVTYSVLRA
jgi:S1-C subfamily serine protease